MIDVFVGNFVYHRFVILFLHQNHHKLIFPIIDLSASLILKVSAHKLIISWVSALPIITDLFVEYLYNLLVFMPAGWYSQLIINPPKVLKEPSCIIHCPIMRVAGIVLYRVSTVVTESNLFWSEKAFFSSQLGLLLFLHFEYDIHLVIGFSVPTLFSF